MTTTTEAKTWQGLWAMGHEPEGSAASKRVHPEVWRTVDTYIHRAVAARPPVGRNERLTFIIPFPRWAPGLVPAAKIQFVTALHLVIVDRDDNEAALVDAPWPEDVLAVLRNRAVAWQDYASTPDRSIVRYIVPFDRPHTVPEYDRVCEAVQEVLPSGVRIERPEVPVESYCLSLANARIDDRFIADYVGPLLSVDRLFQDEAEATAQRLKDDDNTPYIFDEGCLRLAVLLRTDLYRRCVRPRSNAPASVVDELVMSIFAVADAADARAGTKEDEHEQADGVRKKCFAAAEAIMRAQHGEQGLYQLGILIKRFRVLKPALLSRSELVALGAGVHIPAGRGTLFDLAVDTVRDFGDDDPQEWVCDGSRGSSRFLQRDGEGLILSPNIDADEVLGSGGYVKDAFTSYLKSKLVLGSKATIDSFIAQVPHPLRVGPVYDSDEPLVRRGRHTIINTYRRTTLTPRTGDISWVLRLIRNLTGGDDAAVEFILDWLALPLQALLQHGVPMKLETALVFWGVQGAGKDTLARLIELMYGIYNLVRLDQEMLDAKFTSMLRGKLIVICNEVNSGTRGESKLANKLKSLITEPQARIEGKGTDAFSAKNRFNMLFFSNDSRPVSVETSDRRFNVFQSVSSLDPGVAAALNADLEGTAAAFLDFLLKRVVTRSPRAVFKNVARSKLQSASATVIRKFVTEGLAKSGVMGLTDDLLLTGSFRTVVGRAPDDPVDRDFVSFDAVVALVEPWCKVTGHFTPKSISEPLSDALEEVFRGQNCSMVRITLPSGKRRNAWRGIPIVCDDNDVVTRWAGDPTLEQRAVPEANDNYLDL